MPDYMWIIIITIGFIILIINAFAFFVAKSIFHPIRYSLLETRQTETEKSPGLMKEYDTWDIASYTLKTTNGYNIKVYDVEPIEPTLDFVVIGHGFTYTHHGAVKYAKMMRDLGFHVIMYDQRYHGESEGNNCTLGGKEQNDLYDVITDVFTRYGKDIFLGTYGESMGATTVLLEQAYDDRVAFVAADCAFSDMRKQVIYLVRRKMKLPRWLFLPLSNFYFHQETKVNFRDVSPIEAVKIAKVPIFFSHGLNDIFILPIESQILYDATPTLKRLYLGGNGARHAEAQRKNPKAYYNALSEFIHEVRELKQHQKEGLS